jgi:hypothetical protein
MKWACAVAAAAVGMLLAAPPLSAQTWQTLTAKRQRERLDSLAVRVQYGVGKLTLAAATQPLLYDLRWRYDADEFRPTHRYDAVTHTLTVGDVGGEEGSVSLGRHRARRKHDAELSNELSLGVARGVPLDLTLRLGAAKANVDLSDLWLSRLRVETGASDVHFGFATPNPGTMRSLDLKLGAASVTAVRLGNAHSGRIHVTTGVGGADLDFGGTWATDASLQLDVVLSGVTLRVPRDVGVQLRTTKILAGVDAPRMVQRESAYVSDNWERAAHRLTIDANVTLGHVELVWLEQ